MTVVMPNPEKFRMSVNGITAYGCHSPSVFWNWCEGTTDAVDFLEFVMDAIQAGFLVQGDVLVLDNCHTHHQHLELLSQILDPADVSAVFLPKYCPELNPIELVWSKMKYKIR